MSYSTTSHLGDLGAALVDDQLEPSARELALVHLAGCEVCHRDVEEQRRLKARLRALAGPQLPPGLVLRLGALGDGVLSPLPVAMPANERVPVGARTVVRPLGSRPPGPLGRTSMLRDSRRGRRLLVGAASLLLVGAGTALAGTGDIQGGTPSRSTVNSVNTVNTANSFTTRNTAVPGPVPLNDPAFAAMSASFGR